MLVDPANAAQLDAWDGDQGAFWTARSDRFDDGVAAYQPHFLDAAAITPTDTVLDIGCGSGQTTRAAAHRASAGSALGVDLSSAMLAHARALSTDVPNATFQQADAQVHPFPEAHFDTAISRHGTMFFGDPDAAFANIARALRPGGRLVMLSWQALERNEWSSTFVKAVFGSLPKPTPATPGSLKDPDQVRTLLTSAGFTNVHIAALTKPMYFGEDAKDAFDFISGQFAWHLNKLDEETRAQAHENLQAAMTNHETPDGVYFDSAAWLIDAHRT
ncbi:Methyltransferase [Alloactinosynnema sp. L-07]|uniref:class I SAM-dependent methyltransferase n=1 Tax=Alloactinosynnema sp. L-07 TaxID=1653480 RepID=UPI00065F040E|nr:class I SAM-dependent methyltransferase [Alloactinosynnema sp. L-07]CRK61324.1 Methyltransferase [Alloactinosynnema sp. L-07]